MNNFNNLLAESKKLFPKHKKILVRIKKLPQNPFGSTIFGKIIEGRDLYFEFIIYIHDDNLTLDSKQIRNYEPVELPIDAKLWIELYKVFDFVEFIKDDNES